jgi:hypothetical protein
MPCLTSSFGGTWFRVNVRNCHFQIMDRNVSLGLVFGAMENAKKKFNVEDYAIHQATLEQVFLTFKRNQMPPKEEVVFIISHITNKCVSLSKFVL